MARKEESTTRVAYWEAYRQSIRADFDADTKVKKVKEEPKPTPKPTKTSNFTRAEALIKEYDKKTGNDVEEEKKEPTNLLFGLAIIVFLLILAGIIFMVWRYR